MNINFDDIGSLVKVYLAFKEMTQAEFAKRILTTRQSIVPLVNDKKDGEISEAMLFRLYYYFSEEYEIYLKKGENVKKSERYICGISKDIIDLINKEIVNRINNPSKPGKSRERKNKNK